MSGIIEEFIVDVKRSKISNEDIWNAKINNKVFTSSNEEDLRENVRIYLLELVGKKTGKSIDALKATLKRTWRVRIVENESDSDNDVFNGYSLFD